MGDPWVGTTTAFIFSLIDWLNYNFHKKITGARMQEAMDGSLVWGNAPF
jgi:hypothetical protein